MGILSMPHCLWVGKTPLDHNLHSYMYMLASFSSYPNILAERMAGIEPAPSAWKAEALPLCNIRVKTIIPLSTNVCQEYTSIHVGIKGCLLSLIFDSLTVLDPFLLLHRKQEATVFIHVVSPPKYLGTT